MLRIFLPILLLATWLLQPQGHFINDYFNDKTFGVYPGPCHDGVEADECQATLDGTTFNNQTGETRICLINFCPVPVLGFLGICPISINICDKYKNWFRGGKLTIRDLSCKRISFSEMTAESSRNPENTKVDADVETRFTADCRSAINLDQVEFGKGILTVKISGNMAFDIRPSGTSVIGFRNVVTAQDDETLSSDLPGNAIFPSDKCTMDLNSVATIKDNAGIMFNSFEVCLGFLGCGVEKLVMLKDPRFFVLMQQMLVSMIHDTFGSVFCDMMEGAGEVQEYVDTINEFIISHTGFEDKFTSVDELDEDPGDSSGLVGKQGITSAEIEASMDFSTSRLMEILSVSLNDWLGQFDEEKQRPVVNDAIEGLFGPKGDFEVDLKAENIIVEGYFESPFFNADVALTHFRIEGLNSISQFQALKNGYGELSTPESRKRFILIHLIDIAQIKFAFGMRMVFSRGAWVSKSSCGTFPDFGIDCQLDSVTLDMEIASTWDDITTNITSFSVLQPDLVEHVTLGQIFGQDFREAPVSGLKRVFKCLAPAVHGARLTYLEALVGNINSPPDVFLSNGGDIGSFMEELVLVVDRVYNSLFKSHLAPGLTQGVLRDSVNEFLQTNISIPDSTQDCPEYNPGFITSDQAFFFFTRGLLNNMFPVVNDVLGRLDVDTKTDINDLIHALLSYFSESYADFPIIPNAEDQGLWVMKPGQEVIATLPGFLNEYENIRQFQFRDFRIEGLNSIYRLKGFPYLDGPSNGDFSFELDFNFGRIGHTNTPTPLVFESVVQVTAQNVSDEIGGLLSPVSFLEDIVFSVTFSEMVMELILEQVQIERNALYQLSLGQLSHLPCLLSTLTGPASGRNSKILAEGIFYSVERISSEISNHPFIDAVDELQNTYADGPSRESQQMVNTILNNGFLKLLQEVEDFDAENTHETCEDREDPLGSIFSIFTGIDLPDLADKVTECIAPIPEGQPLSFKEAEAQVNIPVNATAFNLQESTIVEMFEGQFGSNEDDETRNEILKSIVVALANSSGTPLSDAFSLDLDEDGEAIVVFDLVMNDENFLFDLLDLQPFIFKDNSIIPGLNAQLEALKITGIERFTGKTTLLDVQSQFIHRYSFGFSEDFPLIVELSGFVETDTSFFDDTASGGELARETFDIYMEVQGFEFEFDLLTAIDTEIFGNLSLGHFFEVTPITQDFILSDFAMECALATIFDNGISLSRMNLEFTKLKGPLLTSSVDHFMNAELTEFMSETIKLGTQFYYQALPNIAHNCFRETVNSVLREKWEDSQGGSCPEINANIDLLPEEDQILRFGNSTGLNRFQNFLDVNLKANDYELWNTLVKTLTTDEFGQPYLLFDDPSDYLGFRETTMLYKGVPYGDMSALARDFLIRNLSTFESFKFLEPQLNESDPDTMFRATTEFNISGPASFDFIFDFVAKDMFQDIPKLTNNLAVSVTFTDWVSTIDLYMLLNVTEALNIRFSSVSSLNEIPCLLTPFDALSPENFDFNATQIDLTLACSGACDFPLFKENLEDGATLDSTGSALVRQTINEIIRFVEEFIEGNGFQSQIDDAIASADEDCAELLGLLSTLLEPIEETTLDAATYMAYSFIGLVLVIGLGTAAIVPLHYSRSRFLLNKFVLKRKTMDPEKEMQLFKLSLKSLAFHPATSRRARILVPFVAFLHVIILIIAIAASYAMHLVLIFDVLGAQTQHILLVRFTILSTVNDIWNSEARYFAVLIFIASCAWPIAKNIIMFVIWFIPPTILGHQRRSKLLFIMDMIGKWSFLDVFIVVMTLAATKTYVSLSTYSRFATLPDDTLNVDVSVTPKRGIVLLMVAASSSLVLNHVIASFANKSVKYNQEVEDDLRQIITEVPKKASTKKQIIAHQFTAENTKGRVRVVSQMSIYLLLAANLIFGILLMVGIFLPLVSFDTGGLIGRLSEEVDGTPPTKTYSIVALAVLMGESPTITGIDVLAVTFFQFLLMMTSAFFPLILIGINFFILLKRFSLSDLKFSINIQYIAVFWSANEVFIVAVIFSLLEIERTTRFIVDFISEDFCSNIESLLLTVTDLNEDIECITIGGRLNGTGVIVIIGLIGQWVCTLMISRLAESVAADRYYQAYNGLRQDVELVKRGPISRRVVMLLTKRIYIGRTISGVSKKDSFLDGDVVNALL